MKGGHLIFKTQDVETGIEGVNVEWAQECNPDGVKVLKVAREAREDLVVDVLEAQCGAPIFPIVIVAHSF